MRKIKKSTSYSHRVFAAVLAATLLFTMPGTASVAVAENVGTEDISESVTVQAEDDTGNTEMNAQEPAEEEADPTQKEDTEDTGQEDTGAQDDSANLCAHHKEHTKDCGYGRASEDGEGSPCTYECKFCPIEDLIAALPGEVTADNRTEVEAQLQEILARYTELTWEEQEQLDLMLCYELQDQLNVNIPSLIAEAVEYRTCDADGKNWTLASCDAYTEVTFDTTTWNSGWYVVSGSVTVSSRVTVSDDVHLILMDGCSLDTQGITVNSGDSLTIYAQSGGTGSLTATASGYAAGIGGDGRWKEGGTITINGGNVTATGGDEDGYSGGAGIGGGYFASGGTVNINGGNVTATGGSGSAPGIGGQSGGTITINGGTVTAKGGSSTADDLKGTLTTTGGTVNGTTYGILVTFVTDASAVTIPEQNIGEGETAARPGNPNGYVLSFFADASYTTPFDFDTQITQSVTIYVKCEVNTNYLVSLTVNGVETKYTSPESFVEVVKGVSGKVDAKLLQDVDLGSLQLNVPGGVTLTLDGGEYTLTGSGNRTVTVNGIFNLTGGTLLNTGVGTVIVQDSGSFIMSGGVVDYRGNIAAVIAVGATDPTSSITITGGTVGITGRGLTAAIGTVRLSGGTYNFIEAGTTETVDDIVEKGYVLQGADGLISRDTPLYPSLRNVTVVPCTHAGAVTDNGNGTHSGDCPYCGTNIVEEPHTLGADNKCEGCNAELKVQVDTSDGTTIFLSESDFASAFDDRNYNNVTVTLLSDIQPDSIGMGGTQASVHIFNTSTLDLAGHTITSSDTAIYVWPTGNLTIKDSSLSKIGQITSTNGTTLWVDGVTSLMGGTYTGNPAIDGSLGLAGVGSLLANYGTQTTPHYAYFDAQGNPIDLEENQRELTGPVTVKECKHTGVSSTPNNNGIHTLKCPYCGYTGKAEPCSYGTEYQHDDTNHWQTCTACGYENKEAHSWEFGSEQSGNVIENYWSCFDCGRTKDHLTLTITVPDGLTYGNTEGRQVTYTVSPETTCDKVRWRFTGGGWPEFADGVLPANLPVGEHWFRVEGLMSDDTIVFSGSYYITVSAAPLTGDMVTLSSESVTYSGTAQEPAVTVKQGETTLTEGTDYDVAYSTTDFTNAGTITVTITGKGNYTGTVETTYTIEKAPLTITASDQTITYGGSITQSTDNVTAAGLCGGDSLGGITLTASTANVPGGNITPSAAGIKNSGGKDATGNYEITYKDGRLTINKTDAEITVGTDTYNKTFGDAAFTLDVTDNNTEADVQYEVTGGTDVVSVSNGTVTIQNAGTATITVSLPASTNYNAAASRTITVNVAQKSGYTVAEMDKNYLYSRENTGSIDLAALLPKDCGTVTYGTPAASGNVTYSAAPAVNDGKLSYTLNSGNKDDEGTITVTVTTRNYTDITITVKVKLTDQLSVSLKTGTEVTLKDNVLTYGEPLSKLVFSEAEFVDNDGKTVEGTLAWKDAAATPNVGTTSAVWVFTPTDTVYVKVEGMTAITVNKATPYIAELPTAAAITYGDTLNVSALSGGTVQHGSGTGQAGSGAESTETVAGTFSWKELSTKPVVADSNVTEYTIVFTPSDTANYNFVEAAVKLTVNKAQNAPNMPGSSMSVSNSLKKVGDVALPEDWEWQASDKDTSLEAEVPVEAVAVYTGADKGNYENETVTVAITRAACSHENTEIRNVAAATCQEKGYSGDTYCLDCNEKIDTGTVIPATGHTEDGGSVTKEPTETEKGIRTYKCSICGYVIRTEEIEELQPKPGSGDNSGSGSGTTTPAQGTKQDKNTVEAVEKSPKTGQAWGPWWLIVVEALVIVMGIGTYFVVRKKKNVAEIIERDAP